MPYPLPFNGNNTNLMNKDHKQWLNERWKKEQDDWSSGDVLEAMTLSLIHNRPRTVEGKPAHGPAS